MVSSTWMADPGSADIASAGLGSADLGGEANPGPARSTELGVEGNARLTGSTAAVLLVLLALEGLTILSIRPLLGPHVFIGMMLVPPVVVKMGSTFFRFLRYYQGHPAYRQKGPPFWFMRALGPAVGILTVVLLASGIGLMFIHNGRDSLLLLVHKASFVLWFGAMTLHVLGHLGDTVALAPADWVFRRRPRIPGARWRRGAVLASVAVGIGLGVVFIHRVPTYLAGTAAGSAATGPATAGPSATATATIRRGGACRHEPASQPCRTEWNDLS